MSFTYLSDSFAVTGQIQPLLIEELSGQGFVAVVCNRPDNEEQGQPSASEIKAICDAQGLDFEHIPMVGPNYTTDDVSRLKSVLVKGKVLAFCRSGNRSSILWKAAQE